MEYMVILTDKGAFLKQGCIPGFRKWDFAEGDEAKLQAYLRTDYAKRKYYGEIIDITDLVELRKDAQDIEYEERLPDVYHNGKYIGPGGYMEHLIISPSRLYFKL